MTSNNPPPLWRLTSRALGPIAPLGGAGQGIPFYCVHSISGDVTSLQPLARELAADRRVYGIQIPKGRMNAQFAQSVASIAEFYSDALDAFQPEGPLFLGGWSAGSFIALEMAQRLAKRGRDVPLLVALDGFLFRSVHGPRPSELRFYSLFARNLPRWIEEKAARPDAARSIARGIGKKLRRLSPRRPAGGAVPASDVDKFLDTSGWPPEQAAFVKILFDTIERYEPRDYCGRAVVYSARSQHLFWPGQVRGQWQHIARSAEIVDVDGSHVTMIQPPRVASLANHLRRRFAEAEAAVKHAPADVRLDNIPGLGSSAAERA
ncbi:MAG TPA: thioesterase domain-containing protein [Rhizomicrobium sp.]|nr:thioesterase domain-containing protein [Rhizomicrobium sp.]